MHCGEFSHRGNANWPYYPTFEFRGYRLIADCTTILDAKIFLHSFISFADEFSTSHYLSVYTNFKAVYNLKLLKIKIKQADTIDVVIYLDTDCSVIYRADVSIYIIQDAIQTHTINHLNRSSRLRGVQCHTNVK